MEYKLTRYTLFLLFTCASVFGQKKFCIEGKIDTLSAPATVFLFYNDPVSNHAISDSTVLNKGNFIFAGNIEYPSYARLVYAFNGNIKYATGGDERSFYIDEGKISIVGRQLFNAKIEGSATQNLLERYLDIIRPIQKEMVKVNNDRDDIYKPYPVEHRVFLDSLFKDLNKKLIQLSMDFVLANSNNILAVDILSSLIHKYTDSEQLETLYGHLSNEIRASIPGIRLGRSIRNMNRIRKGSVAPIFIAETLEKESYSISEDRGKWILLVFWSPTCDICIREAEELKKIHAKYNNKGFEIVAFTIEEANNKHEWSTAVNKLKLPYTTVSDLEAWSSPIVAQYKINAVPQNYLINPDGLIYDMDLHGTDLAIKLKNIYGE